MLEDFEKLAAEFSLYEDDVVLEVLVLCGQFSPTSYFT